MYYIELLGIMPIMYYILCLYSQTEYCLKIRYEKMYNLTYEVGLTVILINYFSIP